MKRRAWFVLAILMIGSTAVLAAPCGSGTLAQIMGTSCTVGDLAFSFSNFNGYFAWTDNDNNYQWVPLDPGSIQFESVLNGNAAGIRLLTGWTENPSANNWFNSGHDLNFNYSVTGLNGTLIYGTSDELVGKIGNFSDTGSIMGTDQQFYANIGGITVGTTVNYTNGQGYYSHPYDQFIFSDHGIGPQSGSDPNNLGLHSAGSFAYTTQTAYLESETFLYFTQPVPEPSTFALSGTALIGFVGAIWRKLKP